MWRGIRAKSWRDRAEARGGTDSLNLASSSEESGANLTLLPNGDLRCRASAQPADSIEQHAGCMGGACAPHAHLPRLCEGTAIGVDEKTATETGDHRRGWQLAFLQPNRRS